MRRLLVLLAAAALVVSASTPVLAAPKPAPSLPPATGLIYASDSNYMGEGPVAVDATAGGFVPVCRGEPSHGSPLRYLDVVDGPLVLRDESCNPTTLLADASRWVVLARWSPDDTKVAFLAYDRSQETITYEYTLSVADVLTTGGSVTLGSVDTVLGPLYGGHLSWAPSGDRLVVSQPNPAHKLRPTDADGTAPPDLYVVTLAGAVSNLTETPEPEHAPTWSPDGMKIAFFRQTVFKGNVRTDVFTMPAAGGPQTQITNKGNSSALQNRYPVWSPDSAHLGFACVPSSGAGAHVCRIDGGGKTKAVDLTPRTGATFWTWAWR